MRTGRWGVVGLLVTGVIFSFFLYRTAHKPPIMDPANHKTAPRLPQSVTAKAPAKMVVPPPNSKTALPAASKPEPSITAESLSHIAHDPTKDSSPLEAPIQRVFFGYVKLVGVITSTYNPMKSKAIIENRLSSQQKIYALGSVIPYGAKIKNIGEHGIILEKEGLEKELSIADELGDLADITVLKSIGYKKIAEREWLITPNSLIKDTDSLFQLVSEISLRPNFSSSGIQGLKLNELKGDGVIQELGLEAGDMISSVNGKALNINSIAGAYDIYQQIRNAPSIKLGLSRQQQAVNLTYHIISDGPPKYNLKDVISSNSVAKMFLNKL